MVGIRRLGSLAAVGATCILVAWSVTRSQLPPAAVDPQHATTNNAPLRGPAASDMVEDGARVFEHCAACHTIGRDGPDLDGPNLYGVVGAPIARRRERFAYTAALRRVGGLWDRNRLDAWLAGPQVFAPGTSMTFGGLADPRERAAVIAYLEAQGHS